MDRGLVERAQTGDRDAYEALARGIADRLYEIAFQITRDPDRADDAVQQALVAMWRDLPSLRDPSRFDAWAYRLVSRASLQELRRRRRTYAVPLAPGMDLYGAEDIASATAVRDEIERALAALSPNHRAVVVLRYLADLQIDEIGAVLGIPSGTVASRLHHATRLLHAGIDAGEREAAVRGQPA